MATCGENANRDILIFFFPADITSLKANTEKWQQTFKFLAVFLLWKHRTAEAKWCRLQLAVGIVSSVRSIWLQVHGLRQIFKTNKSSRKDSVLLWGDYLIGPLQDHQQAHWFPIEVWKWITNTQPRSIRVCGVMVPLIQHASKQTNKETNNKLQQFLFLSPDFSVFFFFRLKELKKQIWTLESQRQRGRWRREGADLTFFWFLW